LSTERGSHVAQFDERQSDKSSFGEATFVFWGGAVEGLPVTVDYQEQ